MNGTRWGARAAGALVTAALGVAACGGQNSTAMGEIKSMPAYPPKDGDAKAKAPDPKPAAAAKPTSVKAACAGAKPPKASRNLAVPEEKDRFASGGIASWSSSKAKDYAMADLDALAKRGAWEELLMHAEDIPPAKRDATWEKLVEKAAIGELGQLTTKAESYEGVFTSQALGKRYPHLLKSSEFMSKRGEAGKKAASECLREAWRGEHCLDMMNTFLSTPGTSADVGFAFGKIARLNQNHYVAVPFFKWALEKKKDAAMCGDEDLSLAVVAGLGLPPDYENAAGARKIATEMCWDALKPAVEKKVLEDGSSYFIDNACAVLAAKGAL